MSAPVRLLTEIDALRSWRQDRARRGERVGFVPTMGKLHEGHLALMRLALEQADCDRLLVSIFVNPTQFGPGEDFANYPRELEADLAKLAEVGAAACFAPETDAVYPRGDATTVSVNWGLDVLCAASRPGHFDGVTSVVARLFNLAQPDLAVFGQKDAQQALIIKRLVETLHFPVRLLLGATLREADGLALSSRNAYLSPVERAQAPALHAALVACGRALGAGERDPRRLAADGLARLEAAPGLVPEYFDLMDPATLAPAAHLTRGERVLVACAARFGRARLIDNLVYRIEEDGCHETLLY